MIYLPRPVNCDADSLHAQISALGFGACCIEWRDDELGFGFDCDLGADDFESLQNVVAAHNGTLAIAAREEREAKIAAISAANTALVESAREKRLRGEQMTQPELAALIDLLMFPA